MPHFRLRLFLLVTALALTGNFAVQQAIAAERPATEKDAKKKQDEEDLRKYDKNRNGKLDPDELAELKADQQRAKRKKRG